ncbi:Uncharacterised protein [Streptococcus pneumoniae]|nr:Uncharacterised protein [Streptococcus pneumoniae]
MEQRTYDVLTEYSALISDLNDVLTALEDDSERAVQNVATIALKALIGEHKAIIDEYFNQLKQEKNVFKNRHFVPYKS